MNKRLIQWEVHSTSELLSNYTLDFYRSDGSSSNLIDYDKIGSGVQSSLGTFIDSGIQRMDFSLNRKSYYILQAANTVTAESKDFGPYTLQTTPDLQALEIIRRNNIVLTNSRYSGRPMTALKKKTWGDFCSECWDAITFRVTKDNCTTCYGTGIEGGYSKYINVQGMIASKSYRKNVNLFGIWEDTDLQIIVPNFPILVPGDLLVDELGRRYVVYPPTRAVEKGLYVIQQILRCKEIVRSDIRYEIPIT